MHRREPDAWNSKYWWRRVGSHPVLMQLRERAPQVGYEFTTPEEFVDFCEKVRGSGSAEEELAKRVQQLEWRLLFDHCSHRVVGQLRIECVECGVPYSKGVPATTPSFNGIPNVALSIEAIKTPVDQLGVDQVVSIAKLFAK